MPSIYLRTNGLDLYIFFIDRKYSVPKECHIDPIKISYESFSVIGRYFLT